VESKQPRLSICPYLCPCPGPTSPVRITAATRWSKAVPEALLSRGPPAIELIPVSGTVRGRHFPVAINTIFRDNRPFRCSSFLHGSPHSTQESIAISKRKPPSQRAERKLDETAREIARSREQGATVKPTGTRPATHTGPGPLPGRGGGRGIRQAIGGPNPAASTKRPKQPGS